MGPLDIIKYAIERLETVIILYRPKKKMGILQRIRTEPYELKVKKGKLYFYAWNLEKNHIASFLADRILEAELTAEPFIWRKDLKFF